MATFNKANELVAPSERIGEKSLRVAGYTPGIRHLVVALAFALLLAAAASGGPDYSRYEDWGRAGLSGDLWEARVHTLSPLGVPLMMWSHGTGFVFAAADLVSPPWLDFRSSAMLAGWLAALVLWAAMLRVLWIVARGDAVLTLLGASMFLVATHGGYFSHVHASESLALATTGVLVWLAFEPRAADRLAFFSAGLGLAFLVIIKPYWALYGAGTLAVLCLRARRGGTGGTGLLGRLALVAAPVIVAGVQTAFTNRWMTGSWLRSSYQFGDAAFRSFDFADPELAAVLVHPWHGLLSYHPFYALGALAVLLVALRGVARSRAPSDTRVFFALAALAMLVNLYIQASWVVWWLGRATFGMRGMAPAAAVVVPAFVIVAERLQHRGSRVLGVWTGLAVGCALWSMTLLADGVVPQFYTYTAMLAEQRATLADLTVWGHAVPLLLCLAGLAALLHDVWHPAEGMRRATALAALVLLALACGYLVGEAVWVINERSAATFAAAASLLALGLVASIAARRLYPACRGPHTARRRRQLAPLGLLAAVQAATFVIAATLFFRLAAHVEADIAAGRQPPLRYPYVNTFSTRDMIGSCNEYRHVPGFRDKREAFKAFLIRSGVGPGSFRF